MNSASNYEPNRNLSSLSSTCFIRPKATGLVSLFIQAVLIIVSASTTMFFFYHVGGYEYTHWNENSTILEPINHSYRQKNELHNKVESSEFLVSDSERDLKFLDMLNESTGTSEPNFASFFYESSVYQNEFIENDTFGIEQVPMTTIFIGNTEFDWLEVIRLSTLAYICVGAVWVLSGILFICTIRCQVLDCVILNTNILIVVVLLLVAHAGLIVALIFFQREMSWRTMSITIGSIVIISSCAFLGGVCICLNFSWVRYIDYMHGKQKCVLSCLFCCSRSSNEAVSIPIRNERKYDNDVQLERFDAF